SPRFPYTTLFRSGTDRSVSLPGPSMKTLSAILLSMAAGFCFSLAGCERQMAPAAAMSPGAMPPPEVRISLPERREVTDYEDFTGRTDAKLTVEVRARVTGYLSKINFKDGCEVKEGDV